MTSLQDPLAKPVWPPVDPSICEAFTSQLCTTLAPLRIGVVDGVFDTVTVGFNSTMAAIEEYVAGRGHVEGLAICRSDISAPLCLPFALASAAGRIRLVALPKGSRQRLSDAAGRDVYVVGIKSPVSARLIQDVGFAQADWAYRRTQIIRRPKRPNAKNTSKSSSKRDSKAYVPSDTPSKVSKVSRVSK